MIFNFNTPYLHEYEKNIYYYKCDPRKGGPYSYLKYWSITYRLKIKPYLLSLRTNDNGNS